MKVNPPTCRHMSVNNGCVYFISCNQQPVKQAGGDLKDIFWSRSKSAKAHAYKLRESTNLLHNFLSFLMSHFQNPFLNLPHTPRCLNDVVLFTINMQYKTNIFLHFFHTTSSYTETRISWLWNSNSSFSGVTLKKARIENEACLRARAMECSR